MIQKFHFWISVQKKWKKGLEDRYVHHVHGSTIHISWEVEAIQVVKMVDFTLYLFTTIKISRDIFVLYLIFTFIITMFSPNFQIKVIL